MSEGEEGFINKKLVSVVLFILLILILIAVFGKFVAKVLLGG